MSRFAKKLLIPYWPLQMGHEAGSFKVTFKITHTNKLTQMHTDLQVTSKHSLWQTFLGTSSLAQKFGLGENLGSRMECTVFSLTSSYTFPFIIIFQIRNNLIPQLWQIRFFCFGYSASPFFIKLPQLFQICQFSRIRIHGQTQSPLPKCLISLLVNLGAVLW